MSPPSTLLDLTFLTAVADADDVNHGEAVTVYRTMLEDFVEQRCLLVARADHLVAIGNNYLFAAVDKVHVARQHRHAADELIPRTGVDLDIAITLVLIRRSKIHKVASFDDRLRGYDLDIVTPDSAQLEAEADQLSN